MTWLIKCSKEKLKRILKKGKRGDKAKTENGLGYRKAKPELPRQGTLLQASGAARRCGG
jgi:hypothetical protein